MSSRLADRTATNAWLGLCCALFALLVVRTAWVCDDAYITLRTVDNAVHGYGLRWNVAERVQSYTHPLWMLLLTAVYAVTREPYFTTLAVSFVVAGLGVLLLTFGLGRARPIAAIVLLALCGSRAFVEFSTSGLENPLTHLLLIAFVWLLLRPDVAPASAFRLCLCGSLIALTRQDAVLLVAPALALVGWRELRTGGVRAVLHMAAGLLPIVVWEAFSLVYYGFLFPNTAYAKLATGVPRDEAIEQGVRYLLDVADTDPLSAALLGAGLAAGFTARSLPMAALATGMVASCAYIVYVGGDFMSGRFITPALAVSAAILVARPWPRLRAWAMPAVAAIALVAVASPTSVFRTDASLGSAGSPSRAISLSGITDERRFYYPFAGLLRQTRDNRVGHHFWIGAARALLDKSPDHKTIVVPSIGYVGYYLGPDVNIIDPLALSDPLLARLPASPRWRIGHFPRRIPPGYEDSVRTGGNALTDPALAEYYDHLRRVTRDPIWSRARWASIVGFATGRLDRLAAGYAVEHRLASSLSRPVPEGTAWDAPGVALVDERGLDVTFDTPVRGRLLDVSVSGNDRYVVQFWSGDTRVFVATIYPPPSNDPRDGAPLVWRQIRIPSGTPAFDRVRFIGRRGDYRYSVGHVRVLS